MADSSSSANKRERPLSPHLQVYKPQMTSVLSIMHRMTGVALAIGTILVTWVLVAAAISEKRYDQAMNILSHPLGQIVLFGWSVALYYHLCNGIRHLIWDTGRLFEIENAQRAGFVVLTATVILTAITWFKVLG